MKSLAEIMQSPESLEQAANEFATQYCVEEKGDTVDVLPTAVYPENPDPDAIPNDQLIKNEDDFFKLMVDVNKRIEQTTPEDWEHLCKI